MSTTPNIAFSVLTPAYKTEPYVAQTIESVLAQTRGDWELIVVDNGRSDEMARIVESYMTGEERIRLIRQENQGIGGARNAAAREARGRYVTCLDSDDRLLPDYFSEVGHVLDRRPDVGLVSCDALVYLEDEQRLANQSYLKGMHIRTPAVGDPEHVLANLLRRNFLYAGATLRRSTLEAIGGFAEDLPGLEDWDTWLRVAGLRQGIAVVGQSLAVYRVRGDSNSRGSEKVDLFERMCDATLVRAMERLELSSEQRRIASRGLSYIRFQRNRRLAREALMESNDSLARRHARAAFGAQPNVRSALVLFGVTLSPRVVRSLHRPKSRLQRAAVVAQHRWRDRGRPRPTSAELFTVPGNESPPERASALP